MSRAVLAALALVALVLVGCVPRVPRIPTTSFKPPPVTFKPPPTTFKPPAFKPPVATLPRLPGTMTLPEMEAALQGGGRQAVQTPARGGNRILDGIGDVGPDVIQNIGGGDDKEDRRPPRPR